jgi:hypothetical protein
VLHFVSFCSFFCCFPPFWRCWRCFYDTVERNGLCVSSSSFLCIVSNKWLMGLTTNCHTQTQRKKRESRTKRKRGGKRRETNPPPSCGKAAVVGDDVLERNEFRNERSRCLPCSDGRPHWKLSQRRCLNTFWCRHARGYGDPAHAIDSIGFLLAFRAQAKRRESAVKKHALQLFPCCYSAAPVHSSMLASTHIQGGKVTSFQCSPFPSTSLMPFLFVFVFSTHLFLRLTFPPLNLFLFCRLCRCSCDQLWYELLFF